MLVACLSEHLPELDVCTVQHRGAISSVLESRLQLIARGLEDFQVFWGHVQMANVQGGRGRQLNSDAA